jgi:hypothetical protein
MYASEHACLLADTITIMSWETLIIVRGAPQRFRLLPAVGCGSITPAAAITRASTLWTSA